MRLMSEIKEELLELLHPDMVKALHDAYDKGYADGLGHCGDHEIEPSLNELAADPVATIDAIAAVAPAAAAPAADVAAPAADVAAPAAEVAAPVAAPVAEAPVQPVVADPAPAVAPAADASAPAAQ